MVAVLAGHNLSFTEMPTLQLCVAMRPQKYRQVIIYASSLMRTLNLSNISTKNITQSSDHQGLSKKNKNNSKRKKQAQSDDDLELVEDLFGPIAVDRMVIADSFGRRTFEHYRVRRYCLEQMVP